MDAKKTGAITVAIVLLVMACSYLEYGQERSYDEIVNELGLKLHSSDEYYDEFLRVPEIYRFCITAYDPQPDIPETELPSKLDLRDYHGRNIVPPIKDQGQLGTCWAFGVIKAAEISYAEDMGLDFNKGNVVDLSEKHLAWFSFEPIRDGSQAGEGFRPSNDSWNTSDITYNVIRNGGEMTQAISLFTGGMGPVDESLAPYSPIEGTDVGLRALVFTVSLDEKGVADRSTQKMILDWDHINKDDFTNIVNQLKENDIYLLSSDELEVAKDEGVQEHAGETVGFAISYSDPGDYSVDESLRFINDRVLIEYNSLPDIALSDGERRYSFNPVAVKAVKNELNMGRGVTLGYHADVSMPGDEQDKTFLNFLDSDGNPTSDENAAIWAHYTYDVDYDPYDNASVNKTVKSDHGICVIGYDDDFPKEYFKDPNGTIGGNGAWLVANSWGLGWGNGGNGTFWISYYDQSVISVGSAIIKDAEGTYTEKYHFVPAIDSMGIDHSQSKIQMANVFKSTCPQALTSIGVETMDPNTLIRYQIYKLGNEYSSPADGMLVAEGSEEMMYAGYHTITLGSELDLDTGDDYSIIIEQKDSDGYALLTSACKNKNGADYYTGIYQESDPWIDKENFYATGVVNPGESYVLYKDRWLDWADVTAVMHALNIEMNNDGFDYDNFPIVAYLDETLLSYSA